MTLSKCYKKPGRVTRQHTCILEWPYIEGEFGPPLAHRIMPLDLAKLRNRRHIRKLLIEI